MQRWPRWCNAVGKLLWVSLWGRRVVRLRSTGSGSCAVHCGVHPQGVRGQAGLAEGSLSPKHWGTCWPACGQGCSDPSLCPHRGAQAGSLWGACQVETLRVPGWNCWFPLEGSACGDCGDMLVHLTCCKFAKRLKLCYLLFLL